MDGEVDTLALPHPDRGGSSTGLGSERLWFGRRHHPV